MNIALGLVVVGTGFAIHSFVSLALSDTGDGILATKRREKAGRSFALAVAFIAAGLAWGWN